MAIQYNFLKPIDQKVRDQGYDFVSLDEYLQDGFKSTDGISYEGDGSPVSYANSGIMTQAPIPGPLKYTPPEGGGGDGGGGGDDDDDDDDSGYSGITGYDSLGNPISNYTSPINALKNTFAFMTNPFGYLGYKGYKAYKDKKAKQELQDFYNTTEAKTAQDMARDNKASNTGGYQAGYDSGFMDGPSGAGRGNAPSDKGGSDSMGSHADGGRVGYFFGGRVNYKAGGRTDAGPNRSTASKAGVGQINEAGNKVDGGNYNDVGNDGGNNNPPVTVVEDQTSIFDTSGLKSKSPKINFNYTDPKNYASLKGSIYNKNILDNDDINVDGTLSGEIGPVSYDTSFTDQGITGTNLKAGNFTTNLNPDMQVQNIGYNNNINGINYGVNTDFDNTMFTAGVNFKNGGLASIL